MNLRAIGCHTKSIRQTTWSKFENSRPILADIPIKSKLFEVALLDFQEFGLNFDLLDFIVVAQDDAHALKITATLSNDQLLAIECETCAWQIKVDACTLKERLQCFDFVGCRGAT